MPTRNLKSAQTRAQEALDVAERKVARLTTRRDVADAHLMVVNDELQRVLIERDYLATNPALHMDPLPAEVVTPEATTAAAIPEATS